MKITGAVAMMVAAASSSAAESVPERERVVVVCLHPGSELQAAYSAQTLASKIFAQIGVRTEWPSSARCPSAASAIQISFSQSTRETLMPDTLAYALPYEGTHIVVFSDRIKQTTRGAGVRQLLAYVMVHEISHILQGIKRHSSTGLMKARWSHEDYLEMSRERLGFATEDVDLIYRGVDARKAQEAGATLMASR